MTTVDEQQIRITLGRQAKELLDNPALESFVKATLDDVFARWLATGPLDFDERERLWSTGQATSELLHTMAAAMDSGKVEEAIRDERDSRT